MPAKSDNMNLLQAAIEREHNCIAVHLRTVPVTQTLAGKVIWANDVEVFRLQSHSEVKNCFAWLDLEQSGELRYVIVLETLHISSPEAVVARLGLHYGGLGAPCSLSTCLASALAYGQHAIAVTHVVIVFFRRSLRWLTRLEMAPFCLSKPA